VPPLKSPFLGNTPEHRFLYLFGLGGPPELLVGPFLPDVTFEAFHYDANGQKQHAAFYNMVYTSDIDGKVVKVVFFDTDGVPTATSGIDIGYDCQ